jgi:hypothetical protein
MDEEYIIYNLFIRHSNLMNEKKDSKIKDISGVRDLFSNFMAQRNNNENDFLFLPLKILQKLADSIETGVYFSSCLYIRKEIWYQKMLLSIN